MAMQMGFRWYGEGNDKIALSDIRQKHDPAAFFSLGGAI